MVPEDLHLSLLSDGAEAAHPGTPFENHCISALALHKVMGRSCILHPTAEEPTLKRSHHCKATWPGGSIGRSLSAPGVPTRPVSAGLAQH